jgi:hypothetical protein
MIQTCASINCNIGTEDLWFLLGHICSYYSVLLANKPVNNSSGQWIGLIWLRKTVNWCYLAKKVMKLLASNKSVIY